jgi:hypothetical protein
MLIQAVQAALASYLKPTWEINIGSEMDRKSEINEREAEQLIKGMGRIMR